MGLGFQFLSLAELGGRAGEGRRGLLGAQVGNEGKAAGWIGKAVCPLQS